MKVLMLAPPDSPHTIRWARSIAEQGIEIYIFGLSSYNSENYANYPNITVETVGYEIKVFNSGEGVTSKLNYFKAVPRVRALVKTFRPDIVHAHFATSYGILGALAGHSPFILSVWGADVFDFPHKSFLHKTVLQFNFRRADQILSTSRVMAREIGLYTDKPIEVIPFGIDLERFRPEPVDSLFEPSDIVIGVTKQLHEKYGIDDLIRAFARLQTLPQAKSLKLLIVGSGPQEMYLKSLVAEVGLADQVVFTGRVSSDMIQRYHNMMSIYVSLSVLDSESFGVAILEAGACGKPVVVSNVGGLPEVVEDGVTGFVVPARNPEQAARVIEKLILHREMRTTMGQAGRARVEKLYNWNNCVKQMVSIYQHLLSNN